MKSKIANAVLSGLGVATLSTLSLFSGNSVSQTTSTDLTSKANEQDSAKQRMACHASNHYCTPAIGGVRG